MKTRNTIITVLTILLCTLGVSSSYAYYFRAGDRIYINSRMDVNDVDEVDWSSYNGKILMNIWGSGVNEWVEFQDFEYEHNDHGVKIFSGTIPADGNYTTCKVIRKGDWSHNYSSIWTVSGSDSRACQTQDMPINGIYLNKFWVNGTSGDWWNGYDLRESKYIAPYRSWINNYTTLSATVTPEEYPICPEAAGDIISLHCKINVGRTDYEESNVWQHAWFYSVDGGVTWESIDGYAGCIRNKNGDSSEGDRNIHFTLPNPLPDSICFYLYSRNDAGKRLIKYKTNSDNCDYDCSITSVERAISNVNAEDNTYSLDGLVAFGVANGDLKIVYGKGKEDEQTLTISSPVSPQSFSFTGLPAVESSGETRTLEAYFTGNPSGCTRNFVDVPVPNVRDARTEHPTIHLLTGTSATLTPDDAELSNKAVWTDAAGVAHNVAAGGTKTCSTMPSDTAGTHYYVYKELYPLVGSTADMMSNGDYEADAGYGVVDGVSTMSAYTFWGRFDNAAAYSEFYTGAHENANNGFAVIRHAKNFHDKYATLTAKHGSYFGLFDAASDGVAGKKAWYANTSSNIDLKLKKGTTYVFSFWAANINNYGEMDNAAVLQFQIEYGGNTYLLGDPLDLGSAEFQNNIWHQCSSTFTATEDADDVTISVVNLNTDRLRVGNDFALDDIQFHAISTVTETSKSYQIFRVDFHMPTISSFTATPVQMGCGEMTYAVDLNIQYRNQPGKLKVVDITGGGSRDVWDTTLVALPGARAGATWDELKEINRRVVQTIISGDPVGKERTYKVYFEDWTTATLSANFNDPVIPVLTATNDNNPAAILPCDQLTYTLNVNVSYRNMSSDKMQVWVDGASYDASSLKQEKTIDKNTSATKTVSFAIDNVPADSAEHVLHVECAGLGEGCFDPLTFRAPFAPKVVEPIAVIAPAVSCSSPTYTATVNVTTTNHRNATLTAFVNQGTPISKVVVGDVTEFVFDDLKADGSEDTVTVYFDYVHASQPECDKTHKYTAPTQPRASLVTPITMPSVASCDQQTFDLTVSVMFTNQDGDLQLKADDGSWKTFYTASTTASEGKYLKNSTEQTKSVTLTGLPADGGTAHTIYYRFNAEGYCGYDTPLESAALTFPQSPTVTSTSVSATPATLDCDATNYTRTVTVNYKNGIGKKIVIEDEDGNKLYTSPTALTTSDGSISPTITLPYIDGASHYVIAYFEGYDCKSEPAHKGTFTAPVQPAITDVTVSAVGETKCSPYNYTVSGTVTYSNADISKKLIVAYGACKDEITLSSASATVDFTISDMTATGSALTVDAYFKDAPAGCTKTSNTFASPTQPSMDIKNIKQSTPGCDDLTYNLSFDVDYIYQHGNLTVHVDTYGDTVITIPETSRRKKDKLTVHVTYTAKIPADGNTHTLYASFAGEKSCSASQTLAAVLSPVITDLAVTVPTDPIACDATSYPASVAVTTQYAVGKNIVIKYKNASNEDVVLGTHKVLTSPETYTFTPLSFTDIGATGTRSVWAYLAERDTCVKSEDYAIPPTTSIDPFTISTITDKSTCSGVKYDLEGHISYSSMPVGASPAVRFGAYNAAMTNVTSTGADFKFTNVTTTGEGLHVEAYFTDKPECFVSSGTFNAPLKPDVQVINQVMADAACNVMTTTLLFDIVYTKQPAGELKVWLNDTHIGERTLTYTPNAGKEKPDTIHAAVSSIPATGGAYTMHVNFAAGCGDRTFDTPSTKFSPVISDSTVVISGESCGSDAYTVTVTFKVKNGQSKLVTVAGKGLTPQSKTVVDGTNTFTFTDVPRTLAVADDDYFEIYFPDALPSCPHILLEYAETPKPVLTSITPNAAPALDCTDGTYTLTGTVGYTYINAQPYIWLDDDEAHAVAVGTDPGSYTDKSVTPATTAFSLTGVPADGQTHTLHLKAAGWTFGCSISQTFTAALQPVLGTATAVASETYLHCGKTYSVTVTVPFVHSGGKNLYIEYTDGTTQTKDVTTVVGDTEKEITLTGLTTLDGASHSVKIWFQDFATCYTTATYKAPVMKAITNVGAITSNDVTCGATSFSITGTVTANVAGETIVITTEGGESTTITSKKDEAVSYTITGLTDAGQLTAQFDGVACSITSKKSFDAVELKPYPTFSLKDITPQCYPAGSYTIGYNHTDAATIKYTVNGGEEVSVVVNAAKEFTITTTGWAAGDYKVEAYAESAAGCKSATPYPTATLTINKKPSLELAAIADVCEGTSGVSTAVTLKDGAAKYDYDVYKNDVLMSDQHKSGQTAASISLSTNTWEPATYKIQVTAYSSADCPSDPKEVSFVINPLPGISELTASQTICEEEDAVSYDFTITGAETYSYRVVGTAIAETDISAPDEGTGTISFDPSALADGSYILQVTAKSEHGCTTTRNATLQISNKPTVALTATTNICYMDPTGLDFHYTVSADAYYYEFHIWQADRSRYYGGSGGSFTIPVEQSGTLHKSFAPYGSPLDGGDYLAVMWIRNSAGCMSDSVEVAFTIYPLAMIEVYYVESSCADKTKAKALYHILNAQEFRYKIEGKTDWSEPQTPEGTDLLKQFEFDISSLGAGSYKLQMQAYNDKCGYGNISEESFTIYPLPTLTLDDAYTTSAGVKVCHPVAQVDIPYTSTDADTYTYELKVGSDTRTETKSASASGNIEVNTEGLPAGDYALSVTAVSGHDCKIAAAQTTTIHINPRPTFTFKEGEVRDCHPSTGINVGYTSTNAGYYSYALTLEGQSTPSRAEDNLTASADGVIALNTTGLPAGTYDLEVTATSGHGCAMSASVSRKVIIQAKPTVTVNSVESRCAGNANISVSYSTTDATTYYYEVVGTELKGHADAAATGTFYIDISGLAPDTYTVRMKATAGQCESVTDDENFVIYPIPAVSFVTPAPIKEGVANVIVTHNLTDATKYDWRFIDKDGTTELESGSDVPASQTTVTLTSGSLQEGQYTLYVTPYSATCDGVEKDVHVVVNNKPTINFTDPDIVCAGTSTLNIAYSTSPDATDLYYTIEKDATTVVGEQHVDLTATTSPLAVNISGLPYGDYTLTGYVKSALESGDNSSVDFTLLAVPAINKVTQDLAFIGCEETYDATIKLNIFNAAGRTIYAKYTDDGDHTTHVETSVGDETATFTLTGLTHTDLSGKHEVKVYVDGYEDCGISVGYDEPKLMTITEGFAVTPLPKSCDDEKFMLTGTVTANCNEGTVVVEYNDTYNTTVPASTVGSAFTIPDIPAGGSISKLKAYFQGKTCSVVESAVFAEPTMPEATISYTTPIVAPACDVTTFDLDFTLNYTYQEAGTLTVWVDDAHKQTFTSTAGEYMALNASEQTLNSTIEGLPADGRTGEKLYFKFNGDHSCEGSIDLPAFPQTPLITSVKITGVPALVPGVDGTYDEHIVTVTYEKALGEYIVMEYFDKDNNPQFAISTTTVTGDGTYVFSGIEFNDVAVEGTRYVYAYFKDSECTRGDSHTDTYKAPSNSSVTFESVTINNHSLCGHLLYDIIGTVSYVGSAVGDLIVELDAANRCVIPESQCVTGQELPFRINNVSVSIPVEGLQLSAFFSNLADNKSHYTLVADLVLPELSVTKFKVDTAFTCGDKLYNVDLTMNFANQRGTYYLYDSIAGGAVREIEHSDVYPTAATFTIARPANAEEHYTIVRYPETGCVQILGPTHANPYTKPEPVISLTPIDRICDSETELILPFVIMQGDINNATITLTDSKGVTVISKVVSDINTGKDTLSYTLPARLEAGTHTITVEVRDTLDCRASDQQTVEVAMDGQIYSKWTDVLLVDNSEGLYQAYKWYENETLVGQDQVLYLPNSNDGTAYYYCLITMNDGRQIYTCDYTFDAIPRSADHPKDGKTANEIVVRPNRVRMGGNVSVTQSQQQTLQLTLLSATGQRLAEYTQTESSTHIDMPAVQGIYMLRVASESDVQTVKIVVY